jgi:hypothetical protein
MNTPVDIAALHAAIKSALAAQFPSATVDYYGRPGDKVPTPGILIELDSIDAADPNDVGTEQLEVVLRFNAYAVRSFGERDQNKLAVRTLTAAMMQFIRGKRWGQPVGAARVIGASPDRIATGEYEVMRIEFEHEAMLGTDVWIDDGPLPDEVNVSEQGNPTAVIFPED